jgi:hypothetical protein
MSHAPRPNIQSVIYPYAAVAVSPQLWTQCGHRRIVSDEQVMNHGVPEVRNYGCRCSVPSHTLSYSKITRLPMLELTPFLAVVLHSGR